MQKEVFVLLFFLPITITLHAQQTTYCNPINKDIVIHLLLTSVSKAGTAPPPTQPSLYLKAPIIYSAPTNGAIGEATICFTGTLYQANMKNIHMPTGKFALSGFRVFGNGDSIFTRYSGTFYCITR